MKDLILGGRNTPRTSNEMRDVLHIMHARVQRELRREKEITWTWIYPTLRTFHSLGRA